MQINTYNQNQTAFSGGGHLPRRFSSMMNHIYKETQKTCGELFECTDTVVVSTTLKNGREVSGVVNFFNGKFVGLVLDEGFENLRPEFIRTVMEKYNKSVAKGRTRTKLGYDA